MIRGLVASIWFYDSNLKLISSDQRRINNQSFQIMRCISPLGVASKKVTGRYGQFDRQLPLSASFLALPPPPRNNDIPLGMHRYLTRSINFQIDC